MARPSPGSGIPAAPLVLPETFRCDRQGMTLTVAGCARLFASTVKKKPEPYEGRWHCQGCPIGAANAGAPVESIAIGGQDWRLVCARCLRRSDRLIHGRHCVSCFNRGREARIGRNKKGGRPKLIDRLRAVTLAMTRADGVTELVAAKAVIGPAEVMVQRARTATGRLAFGMPPARWDISQAAEPVNAAEVVERDAPPRPAPPPRPPSLRDHLQASTRHTWPALVASLRVTGPAGGIRGIGAARQVAAVLQAAQRRPWLPLIRPPGAS